MQPKRFQLKKEAEQVCRKRHPWIFRSHLSTAANVFKTGDWLRLVSTDNKTLGFGIFDEEGLIGIRVFQLGETEPTAALFQERVKKALEKRVELRKYTEAFRAIHGENDGFPGVVVDVYGKVGVLQTYSASIDSIGRWVAQCVRQELGLRSILWKLPSKRHTAKKDETPLRVLYGYPPDTVSYREGKLDLEVNIKEGQKSGTFLDLRGLRKFLALEKLSGKRVLNLFCYTATLGLACESAGAKEIWEVDISEGALQSGKKIVKDPKRHKWIKADIFEWVRELDPRQKFDLIIVDPPHMTSQVHQIPGVIRAYRSLYKAALEHLNPGGKIVGACCTSRISREEFRQVLFGTLGKRLRLLRELKPEDDHPVGFAEGDYLKIFIFAN